jgi:hypothetical protein
LVPDFTGSVDPDPESDYTSVSRKTKIPNKEENVKKNLKDGFYVLQGGASRNILYSKISSKNVNFYNLQKVRIRIQIHNTGRCYRKLVLLKRLCFGILVIEV